MNCCKAPDSLTSTAKISAKTATVKPATAKKIVGLLEVEDKSIAATPDKQPLCKFCLIFWLFIAFCVYHLFFNED